MDQGEGSTGKFPPPPHPILVNKAKALNIHVQTLLSNITCILLDQQC